MTRSIVWRFTVILVNNLCTVLRETIPAIHNCFLEHQLSDPSSPDQCHSHKIVEGYLSMRKKTIQLYNVCLSLSIPCAEGAGDGGWPLPGITEEGGHHPASAQGVLHLWPALPASQVSHIVFCKPSPELLSSPLLFMPTQCPGPNPYGMLFFNWRWCLGWGGLGVEREYVWEWDRVNGYGPCWPGK